MSENKAICKPCAKIAKKKGYLLHYLPPYLFKQYNKIRCYLCGGMRFHYMWINAELRNHPRKVREVR